MNQGNTVSTAGPATQHVAGPPAQTKPAVTGQAAQTQTTGATGQGSQAQTAMPQTTGQPETAGDFPSATASKEQAMPLTDAQKALFAEIQRQNGALKAERQERERQGEALKAERQGEALKAERQEKERQNEALKAERQERERQGEALKAERQEKERQDEALKAEQRERERQAKLIGQALRWSSEAEKLKSVYPSLTLKEELSHPETGQRFRQLLQRGLDVRTAFEAVHRNEILSAAMRYAAERAREMTVSDIRARGTRPIENGGDGAAPTTLGKVDVHSLTRSQREAIARRVLRGERVEF